MFPIPGAAVGAAVDGDVIELCEGTLHGSAANGPDYDRRKSVTLQGAGIGRTVLDGDGRGPVLFITAVDLIVADLTITGGYSGDGSAGAAVLVEYSDVTLERVEVADNRATYGGVIEVISSHDAGIALIDSFVHRNVTDDSRDAGVAIASDISSENPTPVYLTSVNTDWGEGDDANEPPGVLLQAVADTVAYPYEGVSNFSCVADELRCD